MRKINYFLTKKKVEEEENGKLNFNQKYCKPIPNFEEKNAGIRLNVAHIIREEHKLKAKEEEKEKIMKDLEINLRDSNEFKEWKKKNQEKERIEELEHQQKSTH